MTKFFISLSVILLLFLALGCKKENNSDNLPTLQLERTSYRPIETAQLSVTNLTLTDSVYTGQINNTPLRLMNINGHLMFFMPSLAPGSYQLKVIINQTEYEAAFEMLSPAPIADPEVYVQNWLNTFQLSVQQFNQYRDSLPAADTAQLLSNVRTIQTWVQNFTVSYNNLSSAQKAECAALLSANQWWLDEMHEATSALATNVASYKTGDDIEDHELKVEQSMQNYLVAKAVVVLHCRKIVAWTIGGALVGALVGVPQVGAAVGAGIGIGFFMIDFMNLEYATDELIDLSFVPFQNLLTSEKTNSLLSFEHGAEKSLSTTMLFRSPYVADKNSGVSMLSNFIGALTEVRSEFNTIAQVLPASLFPPKTIDEVPSYHTRTRAINSKYLNVQNIDNPVVALQDQNRTNGNFKVTFTSTSANTEGFTFDLAYNHPTFGVQRYAVDAEILSSGNSGWQFVLDEGWGYLATTASNRAILASYSRGIWKSDNNGNSWSEVTIPLTGNGFKPAMNGIFVRGNNIYVATYNGVYISNDNGDTWIASKTGLPNPAGPRIESVAATSTHLIAGTSNGYYLSTDNGASWTVSNSGAPTPTCGVFDTIVEHLTVMGDVVISQVICGLNQISVNGASWSSFTIAPYFYGYSGFGISPAGNVFALDNGIARSGDAGSSWQMVNNGLVTASLGVTAFAANGNTLYIAAHDNDLSDGSIYSIYKSTDEGQTWTLHKGAVPINVAGTSVTSMTVAGNRLLVCVNGGVYSISL